MPSGVSAHWEQRLPQSQGCGPLVSPGPVAVQHLRKSAVTQAVDVVPHSAVGWIALPRAGHRPAVAGAEALVVSLRELPAEPAGHVEDETLLGFEVWINTGNRRFDCAVKSDRLPIDTGKIGLAIYTVCRKSATQAIARTLHHIRWNIGTFCRPGHRCEGPCGARVLDGLRQRLRGLLAEGPAARQDVEL